MTATIEEQQAAWAAENWMTNDGRVIKITELEDNHLAAILRMLRGKVNKIRINKIMSVNTAGMDKWCSEGLDQSLEDEFNDIDRMTDDEILASAFPSYTALVTEQDRRQRKR